MKALTSFVTKAIDTNTHYFEIVRKRLDCNNRLVKDRHIFCTKVKMGEAIGIFGTYSFDKKMLTNGSTLEFYALVKDSVVYITGSALNTLEDAYAPELKLPSNVKWLYGSEETERFINMLVKYYTTLPVDKDTRRRAGAASETQERAYKIAAMSPIPKRTVVLDLATVIKGLHDEPPFTTEDKLNILCGETTFNKLAHDKLNSMRGSLVRVKGENNAVWDMVSQLRAGKSGTLSNWKLGMVKALQSLDNSAFVVLELDYNGNKTQLKYKTDRLLHNLLFLTTLLEDLPEYDAISGPAYERAQAALSLPLIESKIPTRRFYATGRRSPIQWYYITAIKYNGKTIWEKQ